MGAPDDPDEPGRDTGPGGPGRRRRNRRRPEDGEHPAVRRSGASRATAIGLAVVVVGVFVMYLTIIGVITFSD